MRQNSTATPSAPAVWTPTLALYSGDYYLTCTGPGGATTETITLNVAGGPSAPPPAPKTTASITADPTNLTTGNSTMLIWTSTDTDSCTASGDWSGTRATVGTETVSPTSNATYAITCAGTWGSASYSVSVSVTQPAPPPTPPTSIGVGSFVETTRHVHVRNNPGGAKIGLIGPNSTGTVIGGPRTNDGFIWWNVDFTSDPDGWVRELDLVVVN